jgi:hypothetical protein
MAASKGPPQSQTLDGHPSDPTSPYVPMRQNTFASDMERIQSGGLSDDPTESGAPVVDSTPFKNLTGGR